MKKIIIICLVLLISVTGCFNKTKKEKLAPELAAEAMEAFDDERYDTAIEVFNKLRDWYPFDKLATLAEFKIADAHYHMEEYDEAILAYEEFEKLHPRNEAIPYVLYQIAMCYYNRIDTIDRDQNNARKAVTSFRRLKMRFPDTNYAKKSEEKILESLKSIAGHEIYVGRFYYKSKHYKGAIKRFETVLKEFPGIGFDEEATKYIGLCEKKMARQMEKQRKREKRK